jgi:hypothetical protein
MAESEQFWQNQGKANKHQDDLNLKRLASARISLILAESG